jgi:hypothetical protein
MEMIRAHLWLDQAETGAGAEMKQNRRHTYGANTRYSVWRVYEKKAYN